MQDRDPDHYQDGARSWQEKYCFPDLLCVAPQCVDYPDHWNWEDFDLSRLSSLMRSFHAPWWVAVGRALDLWIGRQTRAHQDVDVAVLRAGQKQLHETFCGWELYYATPDHQLLPYRSECWLESPLHGVWVRPASDSP